LDLEFTAEQEELRAAVRAVLSRECPISLIREVVEKGAVPSALWTRMVELDWPALTLPAEHEGLGGTFIDLAVVAEELGRVLCPGPLLPTVSQFAPVVREVGTAAQRDRLLAPIARGERTGTLAVAEGTGTWSLDAVRTTAELVGDQWRLNGTKSFVVEGAAVTDIAVVARDIRDPDGAIGVWVVPSDTPGVDAIPIQALDASRQLATVTFHDVIIDDAARLGEASVDASTALHRAIDEATVALALETVGVCQSIFDIALEYAKDRKQFGVPIGSFQAMKHKFANMFVALQRARATSYFAAATIAEDDPRRSSAVSMAKAAAGDCASLVAQEGIQALGGIGYTWEHDMHLYVKRAKTCDALFGSARAHRRLVARALGITGPPTP
jgi:alkylation response protein AidB-like acyl-CoA dehydrogenase